MPIKNHLYNEKKATQVAVHFVKLNGGDIGLLKLMKLLYNTDREAINRWLRPITYDSFYSLPHGQVDSITYDKAKLENQDTQSYWRDHLETYSSVRIRLIRDCNLDELSQAEIELINEIFEKYKDVNEFQMADEHHKSFSEWRDPQGSSIPTPNKEVLRALGKNPEEIKEFEEDLKELECLKLLMV